MAILDEKGRLFGLVNVVDLAVVLVVLVLVVGGIAFALSAGEEEDDDEEPVEVETLEAQLLFDTEPAWLLSYVEAGDELLTDEGFEVEILERHVGSSEGGVAGSLLVEVTYESLADEEDGIGPLRAGDGLQLTGERYRLDTTVVEIEPAAHQIEPTALVLEANVSESVAPGLEPGTLSIAGSEVGAIEDVTVLETRDSRTHVELAVALETVQVRGDTYFGDTQIAHGQSLRLATAEYSLDTTIVRVGSTADGTAHVRGDALEGVGAD